MILDKGICRIYAAANVAAPGDRPIKTLSLKYESYYAELDFATIPADVAGQEGIRVDNRIRIVQNRAVTNHDVVVVGDEQYEVARAYHGVDDESGQPITDLTLERLVQAYDIA